nr:hypothetical protein [Tanacetum cinerariifolium]
MMKGSDIGIQEKKAKLFNEWERFTSIEGESIESYYHRFLKLMNDLKRNKHFQEKIASNLKDEYGSRQTNADGWRNQVMQNAVQNPRVQNVRNQNGLIGVQGNGNQNQIRNGIQLQAEEYDLMAAAADLDEMEEVNANCILIANLQQASTSGTHTDSAPVYDTDRSAEVHENCDDNEIFNMFTQEEQYTELLEPIPESHQVPQNDNDVIFEDTSVEKAKFVGDFKSLANEADASLAKHKALELEIERLLKAIVSQDIMIIVQNESVVDTPDLQTEHERTKERFENCIVKKETEYAKL